MQGRAGVGLRAGAKLGAMATSSIPTLAHTTDAHASGSIHDFRNEPFYDFTGSEAQRLMAEALLRVEASLGHVYPQVFGGRRVEGAARLTSVNPATPAQVIGVHQEAEAAHVEMAVEAADRAFAGWSRVPVEERIALLLRVSRALRERKLEFCAWLVFEAGKNWAEADADVAETIDFLEFYARCAAQLDRATTPIQFPGERNRLRYLPLGVGAVIPPWNFPLAIMAGMTMAAVVTGNTVVLKPSVDAPTIAARFFALLEECDMPDGVVNLCQGSGELAGAALVVHPKVRFVAFTGSKRVGLQVHERAARPQAGQHFLRRTILELGGKDAIIVDRGCDLDAAVEGVAASAFGFSGQKCSACSRVIVDESLYDTFCDALVERTESIRVGPPRENFAMGPVISEVALQRVLGYMELGRAEGRLLTGGSALPHTDGGYYVRPTIFADVASGARLAQEEIFGPVLSVLRSQSFPESLRIANDTEFGLTGAVYSNSRENLDRAAEEFHVGNLYLNRKCTGAMVGAHPFGGFNHSGTDSKAGGADYLLLFTQAKSIAEKRGVLRDDEDELRTTMGL